MTAQRRCGIVAVVGRANVGKSSLLNRMVGEKVSIVSDIAQTTRHMIRAILTDERGQLVFLDTPGVHKASHDLGRIMNRKARASMAGTDLILLVLDPSVRPREEDEGLMRRLVESSGPAVIALNKSDLAWPYESAFRDLWMTVSAARGGAATVVWQSVSARTGEGVDALLAALFNGMPEGPDLFPDDMLTDVPRRMAVADVIREKLFRLLHDELPHAVAVRVDALVEDEDGWKVDAQVFVNRASQKGIVLGHKGRLLRQVRRQAEAELSLMYDTPVTVNLWVKVEKDWASNHWMLKQLGYVD